MEEVQVIEGMTAEQADQILELLNRQIEYLAAINTVLASCEEWLIGIFWILSVVGGMWVGLSLWRRR